MKVVLPFLNSLASSSRDEDCNLWLRIAADILFNRQSAAAAGADAEFEATFLARVEGIDDDTRLLIAKRLCKSADAPPHFVQIFAECDDAAGRWTLAHAASLPEEVVIRALKEPRRARALAERGDLTSGIVAELAASEDSRTLVALVGNPQVTLSREEKVDLAARARVAIDVVADRMLADALLACSPLGAECASLFLEAQPRQRAEILLAVQRGELAQPRPIVLRETALDLLERLERHALEGREDLLARDLAAALNMPAPLARRIVDDLWGEPLAIALAALRAPNDLVVRALTALDIVTGSNYRRLGALARLRGALSPTSATLTIAAICGAKVLRTPVPAPAANARRPVAAPEAQNARERAVKANLQAREAQ